MTKIRIKIKVEKDIVAARQAGRKMARTLSFGSADQTRLATAISELTRNVIQYAGTGVYTITDKSNKNMMKIQITVEDNGPGIPDIKKAMKGSISTAKGLRAGLPRTKRLVHEFNIESEPGHTKVTVAMFRRRQETHRET